VTIRKITEIKKIHKETTSQFHRKDRQERQDHRKGHHVF